MARPAIRKAVSSLPAIANIDEQLDEVVMLSKSNDQKEGVEYITGADGVKRPMSYYKAASDKARKENEPQKHGSFFDYLDNPTWPF